MLRKDKKIREKCFLLLRKVPKSLAEGSFVNKEGQDVYKLEEEYRIRVMDQS